MTIENNTTSEEQKKYTFEELGLPENICKAVNDIGYEFATQIQIKAIPNLLNQRDILGLAQTGSGKTASFMLPLLTHLEPNLKAVQILVLSPTRELASQVAKATEDFTKYLPGINTTPIYGGQPYRPQITSLKRGSQIVIGTPGRLVDLLDRDALDLSSLKAVVLDEADEMLSMGFSDDLEAILKQVPNGVQTALFSATMPAKIEDLTSKYLKDPAVIRIKSSKANEPKIDQFYWLVNQYSKNQALLRFLESEEYNAAIIFVKTKQGCNEVCEYLLKHNLAAACLHGDMSQEVRESTLNGLRNESINILVATDVAARGLDIDRIDLVINYDLPTDNENYVHRVGRTGRAGREGRSISFVGERERMALYSIEQTTNRQLNEIKAPTNLELSKLRREKFKKALEAKLNDHNLPMYEDLVDDLIPTDYEPHQVLAALVHLASANKNLILPKDKEPRYQITYNREQFSKRSRYDSRGFDRRRDFGGKDRGFNRGGNSNFDKYVIQVGREHGVDVKTIIKTIVGIDSKVTIGDIRLFGTYSTIELPKGFDKGNIEALKTKRINGNELAIREFQERGGSNFRKPGRFDNNRSDRRSEGFRGNRGDRNDRGDRRNDRRDGGNRGGKFRSERKSY